MKKTVSVFLTVLLLLGTCGFALTAAAEGEPTIVASGSFGPGTSTNLRWTLDSEGLLTISGRGNMHDYGYWDTKWDSREEEIQKVVIEDGVMNIGRNAFSRCSALTEISIPQSVKAIVHSAFSHCSSLKHITIPAAVQVINNDTFDNCKALEEIVIPDNVTSIGSSAFSSCESLKSVVFGSSLTSIGSNAFRRCSALAALDLPESLTSIGNYAFFSCNKIRSVTIRSNLTSIGENNLTGSALERVDVVGDNPVYASENGVLFNKDKTEILCYPKASAEETYTVPDSVTRIGNGTFSNASFLKTVVLPEGLTELGAEAFRSCRQLQSITIPEGITRIEDQLFEYCEALREVHLPDSITSIGKNAFYFCRALREIHIPVNVTSIGEDAFYNCYPAVVEAAPGNPAYHSVGNCLIDTEKKQILKTANPFTIPGDGSVTSLARDAVGNYCEQVLTLPKSITDLGFNSFSYVDDVYYDGTLEEYRAIERMDDSIMLGRTRVHFTSYAEPPIIKTGYCGAEGDGTNVSYTQDSLGKLILSGTGETKSGTPGYWLHSELIVNEGVTSIADRMFFDTRYQSVTLPASLESIGENAFWHNETLKTVTLPADSRLKTIAPGAFSMAYDLSAFTIPQGVTVIEEYTFSQTKLQYVAIPRGVTVIRRGAFQGCGFLQNVFYGGSEEEWNALPIEEYNDPLYKANIHFGASWHIPGEPVRENETPATCISGGSWDEIVRCTQCNYEFSRTPVAVGPNGHTPGKPVRENVIAATCTENGGYDEVVYCANCPAELSRSHAETAATGHSWGEWQVVKQATTSEEGLMRRVCSNNASHVEEEIIPKLQPQTNAFQRFIERIREFFQNIIDWFSKLFRF